jgi:hypothetical protein
MNLLVNTMIHKTITLLLGWIKNEKLVLCLLKEVDSINKSKVEAFKRRTNNYKIIKT